MNIYILGDIHGNFDELQYFIYKNTPDIIIQCGDLGIFPYSDGLYGILYKKQYKFNIPVGSTKMYFCPGNHEDWDYLDSLTNNEIFPNVFYMKKGSILTINNKTILFMGGADSVDKKERTIKLDWFPQEIITEKDIYENIPDVKIDVVISHTCPEIVFPIVNNKFFGSCTKYNDPSRLALDYIFETYRPKEWYFGHFHQNIQFTYEGCRFKLLNMIDQKGWYHKWHQ